MSAPFPQEFPAGLEPQEYPQGLSLTEASFPDKLECLFQPKRTKVLYGGRGSAKSWSVARALLIRASTEPLRILCAREQQNSIAESVHRLLSDQITALGLSQFFEIQRDRIIGTCGSMFFFEGIKANVDRIKSYEGVDICWVEEAHNVSENSWMILIPTIRKPGSEIWITFNPNLETDYTYTNFVKNPDKANSFVVKLSWRDNDWFPQVLRDEMLKLKERNPDAYLNVWEGHCKVLLDGAVYANELRQVMLEGRRTSVPYDRIAPVETFWDLGRSDLTTIWFRQRIGFQYRYIDYLQNSGKLIDWYMHEVQQRRYLYSTHWLPHDAKAKVLGSKMSIYERMKAALKTVKVLKRLPRADGIDAARSILPLCWFDETKCEEGFKALGAYHYEIVEDKGIFTKEPVHDWSSHGADSFRYSALATKPASEAKPPVQGEPWEQPGQGSGRGAPYDWNGSNSGGSAKGTGWMR